MSDIVPIKPSELFQLPQWWRLRIIEREAEIARLRDRIAKLEAVRDAADRYQGIVHSDHARTAWNALQSKLRALEGGDDE